MSCSCNQLAVSPSSLDTGTYQVIIRGSLSFLIHSEKVVIIMYGGTKICNNVIKLLWKVSHFRWTDCLTEKNPPEKKKNSISHNIQQETMIFYGGDVCLTFFIFFGGNGSCRSGAQMHVGGARIPTSCYASCTAVISEISCWWIVYFVITLW